MRSALQIALLTAAVFACNARADFIPPADGKLTDQQVNNFIAIAKDQIDTLKAAGNAANGVNSGAASLAIATHASEKMQTSITQHGMTQDEYNWVSSEFNKLSGTALIQLQWEQKGAPDLQKQIRDKQAEIAETKAKLNAYEQAQKDGTRVLSKEQREAAVNLATAERDNVAAEVKTDQEAIKPIQDEIAQHQKEASDAESLADHPPADIGPDDKAGYIDGKKNDAQSAQDAVKEAKERLTEAQKNLDDAKARLATAEQKVAHPEKAAGDDEKAATKTEADDAITAAHKTISDDENAISMLKETLAAGPTNPSAEPNEKSDPDNLGLVKKHMLEYLHAIGAAEKLDLK